MRPLSSIDAIKNDGVLSSVTSDNGNGVSISLGPDDVQQIRELERYAIMAVHRIGEFRVG